MLTTIAVSFLAALGVLYLAGTVLELVFRRELRRSFLVIDADPAFVALLSSTRCLGLTAGAPKRVVVCGRCGGEGAPCDACVRADAPD
ncbi:MAG: hypothetical protein VB021_09115 [Oscillospiraceae bacterium]|nr:hypothetical protein [Oscillospiraceae bacterium]